MNKKTVVLDYIKKHKYFSLLQIVKDTDLNKKTVRDYLSQFRKEGLVFDAGRRIYSTIKNIYKPSKESRVDSLVKHLKKNFPFTEFLVWNTRQLQPLYHHTQQHNITFVETEKESITPFYDTISKEYRDTIIERYDKIYYNTIDLSKNPIIVRKLISRSSKDIHIPTIEKILVDIFVDLDKYRFISPEDYWELWKAICPGYRLNLGYIYNYEKRRKRISELFKRIADIFNNYGIDIRQLIKGSGKSL